MPKTPIECYDFLRETEEGQALVQDVQAANQLLNQAFDRLQQACPAPKGYRWSWSAANTPLLVSYSYGEEFDKETEWDG